MLKCRLLGVFDNRDAVAYPKTCMRLIVEVPITESKEQLLLRSIQSNCINLPQHLFEESILSMVVSKLSPVSGLLRIQLKLLWRSAS